jgi:hypothetical protein
MGNPILRATIPVQKNRLDMEQAVIGITSYREINSSGILELDKSPESAHNPAHVNESAGTCVFIEEPLVSQCGGRRCSRDCGVI